jgi:hypothetical protein
MFVLTEAAGGYLTRMLNDAGAPRGTAVRIVRKADHLKPELDEPRPGDQAYVHDGRQVLLLDPQVSKVLATSLLDVEDTQKGPKLIIVN